MKQFYEVLGTYHVVFEDSPINALGLPLIYIENLIQWKNKYLKEFNEKIEEQLKNID